MLFVCIVACYSVHLLSASFRQTDFQAFETETRPGRNAVDRAACQMKESCQDLRSYAPPSVFLASRDFIAAFYPHLKCPMLAMDVFTAVLKTLRRSGVLWRPSEKLEACFDTRKLYKCPSNAIRLLAAKKLLKVLKHDLDK